MRIHGVGPGKTRHRQTGAALLLIMLVVIVGAATILVTALNRNRHRAHNVADTHSALAYAKNTLLEYALTYRDIVAGSPAVLPCPDIDGSGATLDGESHTASCGAAGVSVLGRLPWRTLGVAALQDESGECLWYVVSGEYKAAAGSTSAMLNPDSNGQLQLFSRETGTLVAGAVPDDRPIAMVFAPRHAIDGQSRQAITAPGQQCSNDFGAASFLDSDPGTGISNAIVAGVVTLDQFIVSNADTAFINDRVITISRGDYANAVNSRHDFNARMSAVTFAIAKCVAAYGLSNPGGANDRRLPWPAPVTLSDYRVDSVYDDMATGVFSGRMPDTVDETNSLTGNSIARVLSDCDPGMVPEWNVATLATWRNWKDHFFYYVAASFEPAALVPSSCGNCIAVNGGGQYAAAVLFSHARLDGLGQIRNAPPLDADTKANISNYLEEANAANHPYTGGVVNLASAPPTSSFNDTLFCVDTSLNVMAC